MPESNPSGSAPECLNSGLPMFALRIARHPRWLRLRIAVDEYVEVNRAFWDERVAAHAASPDYAVARFAEDPSS